GRLGADMVSSAGYEGDRRRRLLRGTRGPARGDGRRLGGGLAALRLVLLPLSDRDPRGEGVLGDPAPRRPRALRPIEEPDAGPRAQPRPHRAYSRLVRGRDQGRAVCAPCAALSRGRALVAVDLPLPAPGLGP